MKKKFLGVTFIITLAVVAALNINLNKSNTKGDLAIANVEALAGGEVTFPWCCANVSMDFCVNDAGFIVYGKRIW